MPAPVILDAVIVGAGFGGIYLLKQLRDRGFNVRLFDCASDFGGVWYWNRYPGARVDSPIPHYEFSDPELWNDWNWTQRFPAGTELREYFKYVADKWDLRKDTSFDSRVVSASWDDTQALWTIGFETGNTYQARFFLPNTGFAARRYIPDWKGIESFKGEWVHPSYWSKEKKDLKGKRIAVIGTGATGLQLVQELAPEASELVLFQRTPNLALPMGQEEYDSEARSALQKDRYQALYEGRLESFSGFNFNFMPVATTEHTEQQRQHTFEDLWKKGDFSFWMAGYHDTLFSEDANTMVYNFWRDKTRARIHDPRKREKLAPTVKPHAFGCKRISLENGYYEILNQSNVHLVDVNETPVLEVTPTGIKTSEKVWEVDFVVCATGYDAITGGIIDLNMSSKAGGSVAERWKQGVKTYLGLSVADFPNMFFTYGPQAPTALCNGPSCAELQGNWIVALLEHMREKQIHTVEANKTAEKEWADGVREIANASLLPTAKSWWMGDNIPGKHREPMLYLGGVPTYYKTLQDCASDGYRGFTFR